jgi:processive 1,2-diacylglycerol beta-glucosyltransferase
MRPLKILVAGAGVGSGHNVAAEALAEAARGRLAGGAVEQVDVLSGTLPELADLQIQTHRLTQETGRGGWGLAYRLTRSSSPSGWGRRLARAVEAVVFAPFRGFLARFRPDALICTHMYAADAARGRVANLYTVPTDFAFHSYWINPAVRRYFVANVEFEAGLRGAGIPEDRIQVTGIPVHAAFRRLSPRDSPPLGLDPSVPTVLVMGSGYAGGALESAARALQADRGNAQYVIVAGKNESLRRKLASRLERDEMFRVVGYIPRVIAELFGYARVLVSRPGGLVCSEALCAGLPMVLVRPDPGQEEDNARYLVARGAATFAASPSVLVRKLRGLLESPGDLEAMSSRARELGRPGSADEIVSSVLREVRAGSA